MAELVDALDLKSRGPQGPCGFESRWGHAEDENLRKQTANLIIIAIKIMRGMILTLKYLRNECFL